MSVKCPGPFGNTMNSLIYSWYVLVLWVDECPRKHIIPETFWLGFYLFIAPGFCLQNFNSLNHSSGHKAYKQSIEIHISPINSHRTTATNSLQSCESISVKLIYIASIYYRLKASRSTGHIAPQHH